MLYALRTVVGREKVVLEGVASQAQKQGLAIKALVHPEEIRGCVFVEGELADIEVAMRSVPHTRGIVRKPIDVKELQRFLLPKEVEVELEPGDVVEVIGGPFKGEKGKVTRYDRVKREVTLEFLEVSIPIPVTISAEFAKLLKKKE